MSFRILDRVRVARLLAPEREVTGSAATSPQPRVGEDAIVVDDVGDGLFLVERLTDDGSTIWLAEFSGRELELVEEFEAEADRDTLPEGA